MSQPLMSKGAGLELAFFSRYSRSIPAAFSFIFSLHSPVSFFLPN